MPGKPFQSKLEPFYDFIRECRTKRWSYAQIASAITEEHGVPVGANTVFSFVKVRANGRRVYTLPAQKAAGLPPTQQIPAPTAGDDLTRLATHFFTSRNEPPQPTPKESKNEKRPYRLDF